MTILDGDQEMSDVAKSLNPMESSLMKNRVVTLFGRPAGRKQGSDLPRCLVPVDGPVTQVAQELGDGVDEAVSCLAEGLRRHLHGGQACSGAG